MCTTRHFLSRGYRRRGARARGHVLNSTGSFSTDSVNYLLILLLLITQLGTPNVVGQSCVGIGQLCGRSTDCCRGCCDSYQCVDRSYCPNDLGSAIGGIGLSAGGACQGFYCPPGQMCVLTQACIPGTPCVPQPMCRPSYGGGGYGLGGYFWRNSAQQTSDPAYALILIGILTCVLNFGE